MKIKKYVIVGGGTAGWISAAILSRALYNTGCEVVLVESPHTPTVGVGEATIPSIMDLLTYLEVAPEDFIKKTNATFKLGIKFIDWHTKGQHYWHQFGFVGNEIDGKPFYQHWLKHHLNDGSFEFSDFSPAIAMAKQNKFTIPNNNVINNLSSATYALHFDAGLVAQYLSIYCQKHNVQHIKAHINTVNTHETGEIASVVLEDDRIIDGDFFIDCTGQHALLINKTLRVGLENWQHYLPVDRAVVVQTEKLDDLPPYTQSTAHEHGWRWQIPLQNRTGNGYVYCSDYCDDESAKALLEEHLSGEKITDCKVIKFTTGKRDKIWFKNCLAVGLSSGFLEPLESTSIHLIMNTMFNFAQSLPDKRLNPATINEFNRIIDIEYACIRDFIVLHYCTSARTDSAFWQMWKNLEIPESLTNKLALFKAHGRLYKNDLDLFSADSWYAVLAGMKVIPEAYDPLVDASIFDTIEKALPQALSSLNRSVAELPFHEEFIRTLLND